MVTQEILEKNSSLCANEKSFLMQDDNVVNLTVKLEGILQEIQKLDYLSPGLEMIFDTIYRLIFFKLMMKPPIFEKDYFNRRYQGMPPWQGKSVQPPYKKILEKGLSGKIIDVGCGAGSNTVYLAQQGYNVVGIDFSENAISRAKAYAREVGIEVPFLVKDFFTLAGTGHQYDHIIDCGLFHGLIKEHKIRYVEVIKNLLKKDGKLYIICNSDKMGKYSPHSVSQEEIRDLFKGDFKISSIETTRLKGSIGDMNCWLATIKKL